MNYFQKCEFGLESANSITNDNEIDKEFEILVTQLREDDEITIEDFVKSDNIDWSKNTDLIDWQQEVREEAIREVIPDTSSASSQAVNIVSNDDDDQEENNPPCCLAHLITSTSEALQHVDDLLNFSMMENDATLTGLIAGVTKKVQNIKLSALKQSNIERFFFLKS